MANVTAQVTESKLSTPIERKNRVGVDAAASDLPLGALVGRDSSGYYTHADDTQLLTEVGINVSPTQRVDSSVADGTYRIDVISGVVVAVKIATMGDDASARSHYGEPVFALFNDEVSLSRGASGNFVGYLCGHKSVTVALVFIPVNKPEYESLAQMDDDIEERVLYVERFMRLPGLEADIDDAYNFDWEIQGANMTSALVTFLAGGGCRMTTAGADNDSALIWPHQTAKHSAIDDIDWLTDDEIHFEAMVRPGTISAANQCAIYVGLKLTTAHAVATDDDKAYFRFQFDGITNLWHAIDSTGGTDNDQATAVECESDTWYRLRIIIDSARVPRYYINGVLVATGDALTTAIALKPGIYTVGLDTPAGDTVLDVRYAIISKRYA